MPPEPPERHPDVFTMTNRIGGQDMKAECQVWGRTHAYQVRLHVSGRGVLASMELPTVTLVMETGERWKAAMIALGWRE